MPPRPVRVAASTLVCVLVLCLAALPAQAADGESGVGLQITRWLLHGPAAAPLPAFHGEEARPFEVDGLLNDRAMDFEELWPAAGGDWAEAAAPGGALRLTPPASDTPAVAYMTVFVEAERFFEGKLELSTGHLARVFLDGQQIAEKKKADQNQGEESEETSKDRRKKRGRKANEAAAEELGKASAEIVLTEGKHRLLVQAVFDPEAKPLWTVAARITDKKGKAPGHVVADLSPSHRLTLDDLMDVATVGGADLSADGELVALTLQRPAAPSDDRETWVEIRRFADGALVRSFRGMDLGNFEWAPKGQRFAYVTRDGKKARIWAGDLVRGIEPVLDGVERLGRILWLPSGDGILYIADEESKADERGVTRLRSPEDRWTGNRNLTSLYVTPLSPGGSRRLTSGADSVELLDLDPEGGRLLFSRSAFVTERPYSRSEVFELDLETLETTPVMSAVWMTAVLYAPDDKLLVMAGPSAFEGRGAATGAGVIPNDYDTQAFLYDRQSGEVDPISREFSPKINSAVVSQRDGTVYFGAEVGPLQKIFRYHPEGRRFEELDTGVEVAGRISVARQRDRLIYTGSSSLQPPAVFALDLNGSSAAGRKLFEPGSETWGRVELGSAEDFTFTSSSGSRIEGRVFLPPGYEAEAEERYPAIVYYYGGTAPTNWAFAGRYPKELWAARGYVVYVLQPSGTTGYGQGFAARHVNDWGRTTIDEIIEGTKAMLEAYPAVDPGRLGCIGASYGGFTTQLLITHTDLFAGAVSHAGISSIASYWGEGWWGYLYSSVATAESYPWNRPRLYTEQSPLFRADKVQTPLLLLHGTDDTNVPPGESEQMYIALKLLGKEVEYVRVHGENHGIVQYDKRKLWTETILAWFERELEDRSEYWEHLYGTEVKPKG